MGLRFTKIVKQIKFEVVWGELEGIIGKIFEKNFLFVIVHYGKNSISFFQKIFTSTDKILFWGWELSFSH